MLATAKSILVATAAVAALTLTGLSFASGGGGGGGGFSGGGSFPQPQRQVDERYEYGKAVFQGRIRGAQKIKYCVLSEEGEAKKLKGRSLKAYKGGSRLELANALVNCDAPEELALRQLEGEQQAFLLYYLNKRYRLKLTS